MCAEFATFSIVLAGKFPTPVNKHRIRCCLRWMLRMLLFLRAVLHCLQAITLGKLTVMTELSLKLIIAHTVCEMSFTSTKDLNTCCCMQKNIENHHLSYVLLIHHRYLQCKQQVFNRVIYRLT